LIFKLKGEKGWEKKQMTDEIILLPVITIIATFLDCGSADDSAFFQLFPKIKEHWLKYYNFCRTEENVAFDKDEQFHDGSPGKYLIQTTIDIIDDNKKDGKKRVHHSIDDLPAFIESYKPWSEIKELVEKNNDIVDCQIITLQDWASFGHLHRLNKKPARKVGITGTRNYFQHRFFDFYLVNGQMDEKKEINIELFITIFDPIRENLISRYCYHQTSEFCKMEIGKRLSMEKYACEFVKRHLFGGKLISKWCRD
jgi:hypothetical protein